MGFVFEKIKKIVTAGVLALIALTLFSYLYYNPPIHSVCLDGATDYIWEKNMIYNRATEGIGYGKTNNEGYMNLYDYQSGMNIDVLVMGSSHLEAQFIPLEKNAVSLLNSKSQRMKAYNISISGHSFKVCVNNLEAALSKYKPEYVVIETGNLVFSDEYMNSILDGNVEEKTSFSTGLIGFLQNNPFLRLLYTQIENIANTYVDIEIDESNKSVWELKINEELTDKLLKHVKAIADQYGSKVIILYLPDVSIQKEGKMQIETEAISDVFKNLCERNDIKFLDMTNRFLEEYSLHHVVPKGFINTSVGKGHLNEDGHRMVADELYRMIEGGE